jgi:hypothetical protein
MRMLCTKAKTHWLNIAIALTIFQTSLNSFARQGEWRTYSSPDNKFSIELPGPLVKVKSFDGKHGTDFDPEQSKYGSSYVARESGDNEARFGIIALKGNAKICKAQERSRTIEGLSWLLIADEDELQFLKPPTEITSNGLRGREYFYVKDKTINSPLFTRGRIFDTGTVIYVLVFVGSNQGELSSSDAERFFNSFRLRQRKAT